MARPGDIIRTPAGFFLVISRKNGDIRAVALSHMGQTQAFESSVLAQAVIKKAEPVADLHHLYKALDNICNSKKE